MSEDVLEADLLVIGAGMAGMTAGFAAARAGARVVVVEKAPSMGGSAALSGGYLWTATSLEQALEQCPRGDPELLGTLIDGFPAAVELIRSAGVDFSDEIDVLYGRGWRVDVLTYFRRAKVAVENAGGTVQTHCSVETLCVQDGRVVGAVVRDAESQMRIRAPWTLLSTGGFQANRALLQQFFGDRAAHLLLRSNPYSSGDGLRLGLAAGGAHSEVMDAFYGHLIAWPLPQFTPREFARHALVFSEHGVLLNVDGRRFTEEWSGDHVNAQRVGAQPQGRALLVIDEAVRSTYAVRPIVGPSEAVDKIADGIAAGARVASAGTLVELGTAVAGWGFHVADLAAQVGSYNDDAPTPVGGGPYYAVEARPGMTFTQGGLRTDREGRVLGADGSVVDGLLAAGADMGGIYSGGYAGGLALASVFGLRTARLAGRRPPGGS